jgi:xanthosine utilization system XapX-like protein
MIVLNYFYFLILTFLLVLYVQTRHKVVRDPLNKNQLLDFNGPELFWTLLFSTGLLALSAPAGLDLMALRLASLEVFCLICLKISRTRAIWTLPMSFYVVFLVWLIVGFFYTPSISYGMRVVLKYLYPLLIVLTASAVVRDARVFLKSSLGARCVAFACLLIGFIPFSGILVPGVFWYGAARAIHYISMSMFSLALFFYMGHRRKDIVMAILFTLPCLVWGVRTSIMGTVVGLMVFSLFRYKFKALPVIVLIGIMGIFSVFFIPAVKEKMFKNDDVTFTDFMNNRVNMDDVNSNARFAMWEYFENRFYVGHELMGSGTGTCQQHFYNNNLFGGLKVMHSDIVQMKCDNGMIAVILYYAAILMMIMHAFAVFSRRHTMDVKICAITAGASLAGVAVTMYSDNVVNYSMCTLAYPFGFYGMMLGMLKGERKQKNHD